MTYKTIKVNDGLINLDTKSKKLFNRDGLKDIKNKLNENWRGIVLTGLRQIGKTTILKQLRIENKNNSIFITIKNNITKDEVRKLIKIIENLYIHEKIELFLIDEVQNIKEWGYFITDLTNILPNVQFVVTGSASVNALNSKGSARFTNYKLLPLSFSEYVRYKQYGKAAWTPEVFKEHIGYKSIFAYTDNDDLEINEVFKEYLESYVYDDIRRYEKNVSINELKKIIEFFKTNTNGEIIKQKMFDKEGVFNNYGTLKTKYRAIDKYLKLLEDYHIIKILPRYTFEGVKTKSYKIYMNPHLFLLLKGVDTSNQDIPKDIIGYWYESYLIFYKLLPNNIIGYIKQPSSSSKYGRQEIDFFTYDTWYELKASNKDRQINKELSKMFINGNKKNIKKEIISLSTTPAFKGVKNTYFYDLL